MNYLKVQRIKILNLSAFSRRSNKSEAHPPQKKVGWGRGGGSGRCGIPCGGMDLLPRFQTDRCNLWNSILVFPVRNTELSRPLIDKKQKQLLIKK